MRETLARLRDHVQKKSLLYSLITIVAFSIMASLVVSELVFIDASKTMFTQSNYDSELILLQEMHRADESLTKTMASVPNQLYGNEAFVRLSLSKSMSSYEDLTALVPIASQLSYANPYFISSAIYFPLSDRVISSDFGVMPSAASYFDQELIDFYASESYNTMYVKQRKIGSTAHTTRDVYTVFIKMYTNVSISSQCTAVIAINADYQLIWNDLSVSMGRMPGKAIYVFENGRVIYPLPENTSVTNVLRAMETEEQNGYTYKKIEDTSYFITHYKANDRVYFSTVPSALIDRPIATMQQLMLFTCIGIFLVCIMIAWFFTRKTVSPIEKALAVYQRALKGTPEQLHSNYIAAHLLHAASNNQRMNDELVKSLPLLKENFLRNITMKKAVSADHYIPILNLLSLPFGPESLGLILMEIDDEIPEDEMLVNETFLNQSINVLMESFLAQQGYPAAVYSPSATTSVAVLDMRQHGMDSMFEMVDELMLHIKQTLHISVSFVVCEDIVDLQGIHAAYQKCKDMLSYKVIYRRNSVIACKLSMEIGEKAFFSYPQELEDRLIANIRDGDINEAVTNLDELMGVITNTKSLLFLQNLTINVTKRLLSILTEVNKDPNQILSPQDISSLLMQRRSIDEIKQSLLDMIEAVILALADSKDEKLQNQYRMLISYMQDNYMRDILFDSMCQELGLSRKRASYILRNCGDDLFVPLLTRIRIDKARELLMNSQHTVNEISEMVGFSSTRYFIQVFKRIVGQTPGKYRQ